MIVFDSVSKTYGNGTVALDNVSFTIDEGEFVVIRGPSGAGKSTILRLILKEVTDYDGTITVDGDDISKIGHRNTPLLRRKVGAAFQDFKILPDRTVRENIFLALDILDLDEGVISKRIEELTDLTGIGEKIDMFPSQLSGGELQRVVIARALAPQPKVIFADEPTGNLDEATAWKIIELLKDINEQGTAVLLATHDKNIIKKLKVRIIEIENGKVVRDTGETKKPKSLKHDEKDEPDNEKIVTDDLSEDQPSDNKDEKENEKNIESEKPTESTDSGKDDEKEEKDGEK